MNHDHFHPCPRADPAHKISPRGRRIQRPQPHVSKLIFKRTRHHANVF